MKYYIIPVPKPRMTRSDKWKKRTCVSKYWCFKHQVQSEGVKFNSNDTVIFGIQMPKSWSKKKKEVMENTPHTKRPDLDNLLKSLCDAIYEEDSHIHSYQASKVWAAEAYMEIK